MTFANLSEMNISDKVAGEIREAIHSGELKPGDRLVERTLAGRMGVSHIPVREALAKLADEGLVERAPRRGARVASLSQKDLDEISSLRIVLEQFVSHRVQATWNAESERRLREIVDAMISSSRAGDVDSMFALDRKFHEALWELADHDQLVAIASQLRGRINGFLRAANGSLSNNELAEHAMSHYEIVDAIASGDRDTASAAIAKHISIAAERIGAVSDHGAEADPDQ